MALSEKVHNRLYNWKFTSAKEGLTDAATRQERALVESLATMLGNVGWFGGDLAVVVEVALEQIGVDKEKWGFPPQ